MHWTKVFSAMDTANQERRCAWLLLVVSAFVAEALGAPGAAAGVDGHSAEADGGGLTTIHWQHVPLGDAVRRLEDVFDEIVFVDRRVDPNGRLDLAIEARRIEEVLEPIAKENGLGVCRLGRMLFVGPRAAAEQLPALAAMRAAEVERLPIDRRAIFARREAVRWQRLAEPRQLVEHVLERRGLRVTGADRIPHDLWDAGELPELTLAELLSVFLIGFDLTFEVAPGGQTAEIVPVDAAQVARLAGGWKRPAAATTQTEKPAAAERARGNTRQVYTLRVVEQPVGGVLRQLAERLEWQVEIDEPGIREAGRSLDARVSFAVDEVDVDALLAALLRPAGLDARREGKRIRIIVREDVGD